ncbi:MAG: EF-P lysine aminoacylase EpmA [Pirellulales bacterium]
MSGDFRPTASWDALRRRAHLLARLRRFFDEQGFLEVETPLLSADTVIDRHLDPLSVVLFDDPSDRGIGPEFWLQTSPEFAMKRLLAAGATAIYQVTRAFRGGEVGPLHNPEFTMVEWYRVGDGYQAGMNLLARLAQHLLERGEPELLSYQEAFRRYAGFDPWRPSNEELARLIRAQDPSVPDYPVNDRDSWLNFALATFVEPRLGMDRPVILFDYPASQAALALVRTGEPPVAERFELYVEGIELANGYHELLDAERLRARNRRANMERTADGKRKLPEESRLLTAMDHGLPPCSGVALGFDRLCMVACGATSLAEVMAFPISRA